MGNNFGTKNGRLLAQMVLSNLMVHPMFSAISTNFSGAHNGQRLKFGQDVDVRLITAGTVDDWTEAAGYEASDSADTNATVNINQHKHISRNLTVEEAFGRDGTVLADYAAVDANALANEVMTDLIGVVKAPGIAIGDQKSIIALGAFGHDAAVDVNGELDDRDVTDVGRFGVVTGKYHGALRKDATVIDGDKNTGTDAIRSGKITTVDGVPFIKYPKFPDNGENLEGIVGTKDSLAIATILPDLANLPDGIDIPVDGKLSVATDPSGLSILVVEQIDLKKGNIYVSMRIMYGVALGKKENIQKIASA